MLYDSLESGNVKVGNPHYIIELVILPEQYLHVYVKTCKGVSPVLVVFNQGNPRDVIIYAMSVNFQESFLLSCDLNIVIAELVGFLLYLVIFYALEGRSQFSALLDYIVWICVRNATIQILTQFLYLLLVHLIL